MPDENAEQQNPEDAGSIPASEAPDQDLRQNDEPVDQAVTPGEQADLPDVPPVAPSAPAGAQMRTAPAERGQRRITRHITTSTTRTETTTDETIVEDVQTAPPVWAAPAGEHPRPVG